MNEAQAAKGKKPDLRRIVSNVRGDVLCGPASGRRRGPDECHECASDAAACESGPRLEAEEEFEKVG